MTDEIDIDTEQAPFEEPTEEPGPEDEPEPEE